MSEAEAARKCIYWGALWGLTGVALGAFGAHGLAERLAANEMTGVWEKAVFYQLVHGLGLIAISSSPYLVMKRTWIRRLWVFGVAVFSGSLYLLSLSGVKWLGAITPIGGVALLLGWGLLLKSALRPSGKCESNLTED